MPITFQIYRFLSSEVGVYLPSIESVTIFHLRDLAMNLRTRIKCEKIQVLQVPHFDGLTIQTMLEYANDNETVMRAFPNIRREIERLPRAYIANIIYTIVGQPFKTWVEQQVALRNQKVALEGAKMIEMDPEIARIFQQSQSISGK